MRRRQGGFWKLSFGDIDSGRGIIAHLRTGLEEALEDAAVISLY